MALLVLAYPDVSPSDHAWIQAVRAEHDPLYYRVVDPHFTLVFPVRGMAESEFLDHVEAKAGEARPFRFVLRCAVVHPDPPAGVTHVFLVPDEGYSDAVKLHDRLYTGPLAPELRLDIPFVPHIGVGNATAPAPCKELADRLNAAGFALEGRVDSLDAVRYDGARVETIRRFAL